MRILSTVFFLSLLAGKLTAFEHIFTYRINRQNLRLPYEKHLFFFYVSGGKTQLFHGLTIYFWASPTKSRDNIRTSGFKPAFLANKL